MKRIEKLRFYADLCNNNLLVLSKIVDYFLFIRKTFRIFTLKIFYCMKLRVLKYL